MLATIHHAMTPVGKAEAGLERGDSKFLIELPVNDETIRTVKKIEEVGWQFESVDYLRSESSSVTNNPDGSGDEYRSGTTNGVYLFRRAPRRLEV